MGMDKTNMGPEPIKKAMSGKAPVPMALPREDDGRVHPAPGMRANTSAAHFADAMDVGDPMGPPFQQTSGR